MTFQPSPSASGCELWVWVTPGASADRLMGLHEGALKVAVSAPPEKGKANKAICRLIAQTLGVTKGQVGVVAGLQARRKLLGIGGLSAEQVSERLRAAGVIG